MTREQEIKEASKNEVYKFDSRYEAFIAGAKWADKHPYKEEWFSVEEDLPCNHEELIDFDKSNVNLLVTKFVSVIVNINGNEVPCELCMIKRGNNDWEWIFNNFNIVKWQPKNY